MNVKAASPCIVTDRIAESRDFYAAHFGARVTFDCGWYVNLAFGDGTASLQFMSPREGQAPCNPTGLMYNLQVVDVDTEHARLTGAGLEAIMPLDDHPWGDRGFAILDPNGVVLYLWSARDPAPEFKPYFRD